MKKKIKKISFKIETIKYIYIFVSNFYNIFDKYLIDSFSNISSVNL